MIDVGHHAVDESCVESATLQELDYFVDFGANDLANV